MAGMRQIVDGPDFVALPNFLWDYAQHPVPGGPHWQQGVTWTEQCGSGSTVYDECLAVTGTGGTPAAQAALSGNVTQTNRGATAFTVYTEFDCSPVGLDLQVNAAEQALLRSEAYQVSRAFWTGAAGASSTTAQTTVWPHLAASTTLDDPSSIRLQTAATALVTGGDDAAVALGQLESALASCYGGEGAVHIPYLALPTFTARGLVGLADGKLRTASGNLVIPGSGYSGSAPAGTAPAAGTSWVYGTGAVFGYRSEVNVREMPGIFDRAENTVRMIASRTYLFGWECCHYAALVTLGVPT